MAREIVIGIVIRGKDDAGPALEHAGKGAKKFGDEAEKAAKKATDATKSGLAFGRMAQSINATLQIAEKAWRVFSTTVGEWTRQSLESRAASDASARAIRDFEKSTALLGRTAGDVLVPVLAGLARGFQPLVEGVQKWVEANKELAGEKIVMWTTTLGNVLISGIAAGAITAARAWYGWRMIVTGTHAAAAGAVKGILEGYASLADAQAQIDGIFRKSWAEQDRQAAAAARRLAAKITPPDLTAEWAKQSAELDAVEGKIKSAGDALNDALVNGAAMALEALGDGIDRAGSKLLTLKGNAEEFMQAAVLAFKKDAVDGFETSVGKVVASQRKQAEQLERANRDIKTYDDLQQKAAESSRSMAETGAAAFTGQLFPALEKIADGTVDGAKAIGQMGLALLRMAGEHMAQLGIEWAFEQAILLGKKALKIGTAVAGAAAETAASSEAATAAVAASVVEVEAAKNVAAANAIAAHMAIPFVGLAIGTAQAAAAIAAISAFEAAPGFASGGIAPGPDYGFDSQLVAVRGGEAIFTPQTTRAMISELGGRSAMTSPGRDRRRGEGGVTVINNNSSLIPRTRSDEEKFHRRTQLSLERLKRRV